MSEIDKIKAAADDFQDAVHHSIANDEDNTHRLVVKVKGGIVETVQRMCDQFYPTKVLTEAGKEA